MKKYLEKFNRWNAKRKLKKKNEMDLEIVSLIEEYLTDRITKGETYRKPALIEIQNRADECKKMIKFLDEIK
jgi:hypothetical protein